MPEEITQIDLREAMEELVLDQFNIYSGQNFEFFHEITDFTLDEVDIRVYKGQGRVSIRIGAEMGMYEISMEDTYSFQTLLHPPSMEIIFTKIVSTIQGICECDEFKLIKTLRQHYQIEYMEQMSSWIIVRRRLTNESRPTISLHFDHGGFTVKVEEPYSYVPVMQFKANQQTEIMNYINDQLYRYSASLISTFESHPNFINSDCGPEVAGDLKTETHNRKEAIITCGDGLVMLAAQLDGNSEDPMREALMSIARVLSEMLPIKIQTERPNQSHRTLRLDI